MIHLNYPCGPYFGLEYAPSSLLIRLGRRAISISRDYRKRYYTVNPVIECNAAGAESGHLEVLLFRRWLVILSKAR